MTNEIINIPIDKLFGHPDNPRCDIGDVTELAESIKAKGVMQNLTVVPREDDTYTVIIGHRRLAAAKLAGESTLPCVVAHMTPGEQIETMLVENIQRADLSVFEQAHGFQMMIDLGETVASVAEKTGFSQVTVRRRIKLMELDQKTLWEVSARQVSFSDLDRLSQVESVAKRNELLKAIGTGSFNEFVTRALRQQQIKKTLPLMREELKHLHAKKVEYSDIYNGKYQQLARVNLLEWKAGDEIAPGETRPLFYYIDDPVGYVYLFVARPKAAPVRRTKEEIENGRKIKEAWNEVTDATAVAHQLRFDFVRGLRSGAKNREKMLAGAAAACVLHVTSYVATWKSSAKEELYAVGKNDGVAARNPAQILAALAENPAEITPIAICVAFGDNAENGYFSGNLNFLPEHCENTVLDAFYDWIISLGYVMSDTERALRDGTHPAFAKKRGGD